MPSVASVAATCLPCPASLAAYMPGAHARARAPGRAPVQQKRFDAPASRLASAPATSVIRKHSLLGAAAGAATGAAAGVADPAHHGAVPMMHAPPPSLLATAAAAATAAAGSSPHPPYSLLPPGLVPLMGPFPAHHGAVPMMHAPPPGPLATAAAAATAAAGSSPHPPYSLLPPVVGQSTSLLPLRQPLLPHLRLLALAPNRLEVVNARHRQICSPPLWRRRVRGNAGVSAAPTAAAVIVHHSL